MHREGSTLCKDQVPERTVASSRNTSVCRVSRSATRSIEVILRDLRTPDTTLSLSFCLAPFSRSQPRSADCIRPASFFVLPGLGSDWASTPLPVAATLGTCSYPASPSSARSREPVDHWIHEKRGYLSVVHQSPRMNPGYPDEGHETSHPAWPRQTVVAFSAGDFAHPNLPRPR